LTLNSKFSSAQGSQPDKQICWHCWLWKNNHFEYLHHFYKAYIYWYNH